MVATDGNGDTKDDNRGGGGGLVDKFWVRRKMKV